MWKFIINIPRYIWLTLRHIRETIWNIIMLIFAVAVIGSLGGSTKIEPKQSALLLDIKGVIVDEPAANNALQTWVAEMMGEDTSATRENSIFELTEKIKKAKTDTRITGLIISLGQFYGANSANLQMLGEAIKDFKTSDKPVIAISDSYSQQDYLIASYADEIHLAPHGSVDIHGFATTGIYFKTLLDNLGVNTHIFRVGTHKSAVEPYMRDDMSPEAREMTERYLSALWDNYLTQVSNNRQLPSKEAFFKDSTTLINRLKASNGNLAKLAYDAKWVDSLSNRNQVDYMLELSFGLLDEKNTPNLISVYDYNLDTEFKKLTQKPNLAVIVIDGPIVDGKSGPGYVGAETVVAQIHEAKHDSNIKGILLRVNSPGGSVTAAEVILAELESFKLTKRPIVASFGGVAASGGYWISTPANRIYANENTITGSIGIFGVIPTVENTLSKVGVFSSSVATTDFGAGSMTEALSDDLKQMIQLNIEYGYQRFISLVSASRHLSFERVDKVAQGQVWIAKDALNHKLIDEIGNFDSATNKLAELAEVKEPVLKWFNSEPSLFEALVLEMNKSTGNALQSYLPAHLVTYLEKLNEQQILLSKTKSSLGGVKAFAICEVCTSEKVNDK